MSTETMNIEVPVKWVSGRWTTETPAGTPFIFKGERSSPFQVRVRPKYVGPDAAPGSVTEKIEIESAASVLTMGATTDEYFEFSGYYQEALVTIIVRQVTAFRRGGTTRADLEYQFTMRILALDGPPPLPDGTFLYVEPSRPVLYLDRPGEVLFAVVMGDSYIGHDVREWKMISFAPSDSTEPELSFSWKGIPSGISVKTTFKKNANYILTLQPDNVSSDRQIVYVTTRPKPLGNTTSKSG